MADLRFERGVEGHECFHVLALQVKKLIPMLSSLYGPELGGGKERTDDLPEITRVGLVGLFFRKEPKDVVFADRRTDASTEGTGPFAIALAIRMLLQVLAHGTVLEGFSTGYSRHHRTRHRSSVTSLTVTTTSTKWKTLSRIMQ